MEGGRDLLERGMSSLMVGEGQKPNPNAPPLVVKGQWTAEEDQLLVDLVETYGDKKWSHIARMLVGRVGKQCRERWHNHLRPNIKKDSWTREEEMALVAAHAELGNRWAEIARRIPGRTENSIKNHWNTSKRKRLARRKYRSAATAAGEPHLSVLLEYMNSLDQLPSAEEGKPGNAAEVGPASEQKVGWTAGWSPAGLEPEDEEDLSIIFDWNNESSPLPPTPVNEEPVEMIFYGGEVSKVEDDDEGKEIDIDDLISFPADDDPWK